MHQDANNLAVADHFLEVIFNGLLSEIIGPLLGGFCEGLLLGLEPNQLGSEMVNKHNLKD